MVDCNSEVMESNPWLGYIVDFAAVDEKDNCSSAVDPAVTLNVSAENCSDEDAGSAADGRNDLKLEEAVILDKGDNCPKATGIEGNPNVYTENCSEENDCTVAIEGGGMRFGRVVDTDKADQYSCPAEEEDDFSGPTEDGGEDNT